MPRDEDYEGADYLIWSKTYIDNNIDEYYNKSDYVNWYKYSNPVNE